jgi:hypothetical protein
VRSYADSLSAVVVVAVRIATVLIRKQAPPRTLRRVSACSLGPPLSGYRSFFFESEFVFRGAYNVVAKSNDYQVGEGVSDGCKPSVCKPFIYTLYSEPRSGR